MVADSLTIVVNDKGQKRTTATLRRAVQVGWCYRAGENFQYTSHFAELKTHSNAVLKAGPTLLPHAITLLQVFQEQLQT